jgi:hypothetical protein
MQHGVLEITRPVYGEACRLGAARPEAEGIVHERPPNALPR